MTFDVNVAQAVHCSGIRGKPDTALLLQLLIHEDSLQGIAQTKRTALWNKLLLLVRTAIALLFKETNDDDQNKENHSANETVVAGNLLHSAVLLISTVLQTEGSEDRTPALFHIIQLLHDSLLRIDADLFDWNAKERISHLCEKWFTLDLEGKEMVAAQTISYLLMKSLSDGAKSSDVKRVHAMRKALLLLDFADESSSSLKSLLLYCFGSSLYLKSSEGCKFLVYLFGLHPPFIDRIHSTIKTHIIGAGKPALECYGDIYFKAWKNASGPYLTKIENGCIQDLMNHAVHAHWRPSNTMSCTSSIASRLRKVLERIHNQKKFRGVDGMLYRLYEPILWRSLKVANSVVRRNATALLIDAFPLEDPEAPSFEKDANLQRHFDCLEDLLKDPSVTVRVVAVQGICKIFAIYWEVIPAKVLSDFLNCIINDLAYDTSSNMIRISVLQGLTFLLENMMLSHAMLKPKLASLGKLLHDQAEKVRVAFLDMLIVISGIKDIKFYAIVEIPLLLARLESDSPSVCKRITSLLTNSFFPLKKTVGVRIERCKILLETNRIAVRNYYFYLVKYVPEESVAVFIVGLMDMLKLGLSVEVIEGEEPKAKRSRSKYKKPEPKGNAHNGSDDEVMNMIREHFDGFLEVVAILLHGVLGSRKSEGKIQTIISSALSTVSLSSLLDHTTSPAGREAAYSVARYMPKESTESLQETVSTCSATTSEGLAAVTCLGSSGRLEVIVDQVLDWIRVCPLNLKPAYGTKGKKARGKKTGGAEENCQAGERGLMYLTLLLSDPTLRESLLSLPQFEEIYQLLRNSVSIAEEMISGGMDDIQQRIQNRLLISGLETMFRLAMHRHALGDDGDDGAFDLDPYRRLIQMIDNECLGRIRVSDDDIQKPATEIPKRSSTRKRKTTNHSDSEESDPLESVCETVLKMGVEIVSLGRSEPGFTVVLTRCLENVLKSIGSVGIRWIPIFCKHVEQLSQLAELERTESKNGRRREVDDGEDDKEEEEERVVEVDEDGARKLLLPFLIELLRFLHRIGRDGDAIRKALQHLPLLLTQAVRTVCEDDSGLGDPDDLDLVLAVCLDFWDDSEEEDANDDTGSVIPRWIVQTISRTPRLGSVFRTRVSRDGRFEPLRKWVAEKAI